MCLEDALYSSGRTGGGGPERSEDGESVAPNDVSDLYRLNGMMAQIRFYFICTFST